MTVRSPAGCPPVTCLSYAVTDLTAHRTCREPAAMPRDLLLYERVHLDLARHASARCPQR